MEGKSMSDKTVERAVEKLKRDLEEAELEEKNKKTKKAPVKETKKGLTKEEIDLIAKLVREEE